ncbi:MAG: hypothetical protein EOP43_05295 [Sphingobacteriaceae bacterium]|nr:MAG: hypothetical protein EOP43_05295 [Sphingobacteriaceae bacterium]
MEVYFTSPTIGKVYGLVSTEDHKTYHFKGNNVLVSIELCRDASGWVCQKEHWLHDHQVLEIGLQIDKLEKWLSAQ